MAGEKFAAGVLKEALGLKPEDMEGLKKFIDEMKNQGPDYIKRVKMTEARTLAIALTLKKLYPKEWGESEKEAMEYLKKMDKKDESD